MAVALAVAIIIAPRAGTVVVFGPQVLTRTTGKPNVFDYTFKVASPSPLLPYTLHIDNHGVTSAVVTLNGIAILSEKDFKASKPDDWRKSADWDDQDWDEVTGSKGSN